MPGLHAARPEKLKPRPTNGVRWPSGRPPIAATGQSSPRVILTSPFLVSPLPTDEYIPMSNFSASNKRLLLLALAVVSAGAIALMALGFGFAVGRLSDGVRFRSPSYASEVFPADALLRAPDVPGTARLVAAPQNFEVFWEAVALIQAHFNGEVPHGRELTYAAISGVLDAVGVCDVRTSDTYTQFKPSPAPQFSPPNFVFFWRSINQIYHDCGTNLPEPDQLAYLAIEGVIRRLDDHYTSIIPPQEAEEFRNDLESTFEGIGATVAPADEEAGTGVSILFPFPGSPAEKAGLRPDDVILAVDDVDVTGMPLDRAVRLIRGPSGTHVLLTIRRGVEAPFQVDVVRARIEIPILRAEIRDDHLLYIALADFSGRSAPEMRRALQQGVDAGVEGVILDLRNNPGGRLDMAIDIAGMFIADGIIVSESGERDIDHRANGTPLVPGLPLAVLVNGGSASAAEIVAGAIQDHGRGVLIGETTFGKGSVQQIFTLSDGSILRVTVARWFTPHGRLIDGRGLTPDIEVPFDFQGDGGEDPQLQAAVDYLLGP
ncbi:MAG: S41 family peptidase [Caldilineae bacterium]|nr:MAG: S41 family peptidase [Caldilineae bacterium]